MCVCVCVCVCVCIHGVFCVRGSYIESVLVTIHMNMVALLVLLCTELHVVAAHVTNFNHINLLQLCYLLTRISLTT